MYLKQENPELGARQCVAKSVRMMDGWKWKRFLLDLSFIFWYILSIITLGILLIFVIPYHRQAQYNFYQNQKKSIAEELPEKLRKPK